MRVRKGALDGWQGTWIDFWKLLDSSDLRVFFLLFLKGTCMLFRFSRVVLRILYSSFYPCFVSRVPVRTVATF